MSIRALEKERFIVYSRTDYPEYYAWLKTLCRPYGFEPRIGEEYDGVTGLIAAVEAGQGIAIVPSSLACMSGQRLKLLEIKPGLSPFTVGAAYTEKSSELAKGFISAAKQAVKEDV